MKNLRNHNILINYSKYPTSKLKKLLKCLVIENNTDAYWTLVSDYIIYLSSTIRKVLKRNPRRNKLPKKPFLCKKIKKILMRVTITLRRSLCILKLILEVNFMWFISLNYQLVRLTTLKFLKNTKISLIAWAQKVKREIYLNTKKILSSN